MLPYSSIMPRAVVENVDLSYLLIRPVKVSHCGKPSIVDRVGEDGSSPGLVHFHVAVHMAYRALCQDVVPL